MSIYGTFKYAANKYGVAGGGFFTLNATLKKNVSSSFTLDACLVTKNTKFFTLDATLLKNTQTSFTLDACFYKLITANFTLDACLVKRVYSSFTLDATLLKTTTTSFTLDACLATISDRPSLLSADELATPIFSTLDIKPHIDTLER
jgi:hypothetical protein